MITSIHPMFDSSALPSAAKVLWFQALVYATSSLHKSEWWLLIAGSDLIRKISKINNRININSRYEIWLVKASHLTVDLLFYTQAEILIFSIIIYSAGHALFTSASGWNGAMGRVYIAFILLIGNSLPILAPYSVNYLVKKCCICLIAKTD